MNATRSVACVSLFFAVQCWASDPASKSKPLAEKTEQAPLALENPEVRKTLREAARQLASDAESRDIPDEKIPTGVSATKVAAAFRLEPPERQPVVVECRLSDCLGYDATGKVVRTMPPPESPGYLSTNDPDDWYSCQSRNNMLSTFERFDKCAGIRASTSFFAR